MEDDDGSDELADEMMHILLTTCMMPWGRDLADDEKKTERSEVETTLTVARTPSQDDEGAYELQRHRCFRLHFPATAVRTTVATRT